MNYHEQDGSHLDKLPFNEDEIAQFLYEHLEEFGDPKSDILDCLAYVKKRGGFVVLAEEDNEIKGAVIVNHTGMKGYIPEHILVYIAVHHDQRGKGIGKACMNKAIEKADGDIALHVEPHNPAKHLYEKLGFENKYLEMRLTK